MRCFKVHAATNRPLTGPHLVGHVDAILIINMLGIGQHTGQHYGAAISKALSVTLRVTARTSVEFVEFGQSAKADNRLNIRVTLPVSARERIERTYFLPEVFGQIVMSKQRSRSLNRKSPKGESLGAHPTAHREACQKSFNQIATRLLRFTARLFTDACRKSGVICNCHAAAISVNALQQLKAEEGRVSESTYPPASVTRPRRLRAIFNNNEVV